MNQNQTLTVQINTTPLTTGHAVRGIGSYTRNLIAELEKIPGITVLRSSKPTPETRIDVVHYPFFDLFFDTLPLQLFRKTIVTVHDVIPLVFPDQYKPGIRGSIRFRKQLLALRTARAVITDSEHSKRDIVARLALSEKRVHVIPLAGNPNLSAQPPRSVIQVRQELSLPEQYVLYVGDINYNKNIPQLIKMMKFLPEQIHLACVGKQFVPQEIPEWQWIETQLALSDVSHRVHFLTNILVEDTQQLSAIFTGAAAYVQPSLYEGFGLPLLEAMQCKTPVVSSDRSSLPEVGGAHALYAPPEAELLAARVEEVLAWSKAKRKTWLASALKWSQSFSWKKTAEQTAAVYAAIAAQPGNSDTENSLRAR